MVFPLEMVIFHTFPIRNGDFPWFFLCFPQVPPGLGANLRRGPGEATPGAAESPAAGGARRHGLAGAVPGAGPKTLWGYINIIGDF